ncbi:hypothetical protein [Mycoplasmopsis glycophila]|uniref:Uncharacterized protein n=1 Tax=Mycoplasmopsis glycophila TaxID=171285 RepID=A0A449AWA5_9BACT|nr:hypothetical protein [Mycoplasmopsis glycophila]VEU70940.1 Uncharacterised protein [Mycoplasmopsis glycophila]
MNNLEKLLTVNDADFKLVVTKIAKQLEFRESVIEKDFWVTFLLNYLFQEFKFKNYIVLKAEHLYRKFIIL